MNIITLTSKVTDLRKKKKKKQNTKVGVGIVSCRVRVCTSICPKHTVSSFSVESAFLERP